MFITYADVSFTAVPPSQTAPETVSLLQQPVQSTKYTSTIVIQGRSGYREKSRPRAAHYSNQHMASSQYYGQVKCHFKIN